MKTRTTPTGAAITPSEIRDLTTPLTDDASLDPLQASIGDARFVLLGEASHGTAEYYRWGAALTQRLIAEHDFSFVGVEGDWPDCFRVNDLASARTTVGRRSLRSSRAVAS
jgi:erythromycin esterase